MNRKWTEDGQKVSKKTKKWTKNGQNMNTKINTIFRKIEIIANIYLKMLNKNELKTYFVSSSISGV